MRADVGTKLRGRPAGRIPLAVTMVEDPNPQPMQVDVRAASRCQRGEVVVGIHEAPAQLIRFAGDDPPHERDCSGSVAAVFAGKPPKPGIHR